MLLRTVSPYLLDPYLFILSAHEHTHLHIHILA